MDTILLSQISIIISSIGTLIVGITAFFLWWQIKSNHEWNRRKSTQDTLDKLVIGEFPEFRKKLEVDYKCKIWDKDEDYNKFTLSLSEETKMEIDSYLQRILNVFEIISINIKNNVIDDEICHDYLGWLYTEYYRWSKPFIEERRRRADDLRVLLNFTNCAENWKEKMEQDKKNSYRKIPAVGKSKL